jgi:hypothetical protein
MKLMAACAAGAMIAPAGIVRRCVATADAGWRAPIRRSARLGGTKCQPALLLITTSWVPSGWCTPSWARFHGRWQGRSATTEIPDCASPLPHALRTFPFSALSYRFQNRNAGPGTVALDCLKCPVALCKQVWRTHRYSTLRQQFLEWLFTSSSTTVGLVRERPHPGRDESGPYAPPRITPKDGEPRLSLA